MKLRDGSVLDKKTILESDHFPACPNKRMSSISLPINHPNKHVLIIELKRYESGRGGFFANDLGCFACILALGLGNKINRFRFGDTVAKKAIELGLIFNVATSSIEVLQCVSTCKPTKVY